MYNVYGFEFKKNKMTRYCVNMHALINLRWLLLLFHIWVHFTMARLKHHIFFALEVVRSNSCSDFAFKFFLSFFYKWNQFQIYFQVVRIRFHMSLDTFSYEFGKWMFRYYLLEFLHFTLKSNTKIFKISFFSLILI